MFSRRKNSCPWLLIDQVKLFMGMGISHTGLVFVSPCFFCCILIITEKLSDRPFQKQMLTVSFSYFFTNSQNFNPGRTARF